MGDGQILLPPGYRPPTNGGDWTAGLPAKVRAWGVLVSMIGVSGVISIGLTYAQAKTLPDIQLTQLTMRLQAEQHYANTEKVNAEIKLLLEKILLTQQIICAQGEKTDERKRACFELKQPY